MDYTAHAEMLRRRLPPGDAMPHDGSTPVYDALLHALSYEPARGDDDALTLVRDFIPDGSTSTTFLADWERLLALDASGITTAQRWQAIRARLRGYSDPTRTALEDMLQALRGSTDLVLSQGLQTVFRAGASAAGDACAGLRWLTTWWAQYMPSALPTTPDDFSSWTTYNGATVSAAAARSPVTLDTTASHVALPVGGGISVTPTIAAGDTVHTSVWIKSADTTDVTLRRSWADLAGVFTDDDYLARAGGWDEIPKDYAASAGANTPALILWNPGAASINVYLSWCVAGVRDTVFETAARALPFPLHTTGVFVARHEFG